MIRRAILFATWTWCVVAASAPFVLAGPEAPRPAPLAIPAAISPGPRLESKGMVVSRTDAERTPAPHALRGVASWYGADGMIAAAGPSLRRALGRDWRGQRVTVTANGRAVTVQLVDWCLCKRRAIDLSDDAFARLERLSAGLVRVTIILGAPATDR